MMTSTTVPAAPAVTVALLAHDAGTTRCARRAGRAPAGSAGRPRVGVAPRCRPPVPALHVQPVVRDSDHPTVGGGKSRGVGPLRDLGLTADAPSHRRLQRDLRRGPARHRGRPLLPPHGEDHPCGVDRLGALRLVVRREPRGDLRRRVAADRTPRRRRALRAHRRAAVAQGPTGGAHVDVAGHVGATRICSPQGDLADAVGRFRLLPAAAGQPCARRRQPDVPRSPSASRVGSRRS